MTSFTVRRARTADVPGIIAVVDPYVGQRILLGKERVEFYEAISEFRVAEVDGAIIGCGALHVMWEDLGEIRTLAVHDDWRGRGVGHELLEALVEDAVALGLSRLFCLTFESAFFSAHGFHDMGDETVDPVVYAELLRSHDEGVAEFLDLARVKQNTLGNSRMLRTLTTSHPTD